MKKIICQEWDESERGWGCRPDGASYHLSLGDCQAYIKAYWDRMPKETPDEYSRPSGNPYEMLIPDDIYEKLDIHKNNYGIRVWQSDFRKHEELSKKAVKAAIEEATKVPDAPVVVPVAAPIKTTNSVPAKKVEKPAKVKVAAVEATKKIPTIEVKSKIKNLISLLQMIVVETEAWKWLVSNYGVSYTNTAVFYLGEDDKIHCFKHEDYRTMDHQTNMVTLVWTGDKWVEERCGDPIG